MMRKSILWIPVLMMGSMMFWTIALNFGGLSLIALTSSLALDQDGQEDGADGAAVLPDGLQSGLKDSYQSITVNLSDSSAPAEPGAADDSTAVNVDVVPDHETTQASERQTERGMGVRSAAGRSNQGPGETAF